MTSEKTKFPSVSNLGGYTISYIGLGDGLVYCADCANKADEETQDTLNQYIHWEGNSITCDECNIEIESEYGE